MAELKTKPNDQSVDYDLNKVPDENKRQDRFAILELKKLLSDKEEILLKREKDFLFLKQGDLLFYCRLSGGNFPEYEQIIPKEFVASVVLPRKGLLAALARVSILSDSRSNPVVLDFSKKNRFLVRSNSPELGEGKEVPNVKPEGEPLVIGFNARYLIEPLRVLTTEEVQIQFSGASTPCVLSGVGNGEFFCLVMPMNLLS